MFNYNVHPILVHFPIALLTLYCLMELVSWGRLRASRSFVFAKAILATVGGLTLLAARQFGDIARHMLPDNSLLPLVSRHETFANITTGIFGIIGVVYLLALIEIYLERYPDSFLKFLSPVVPFSDKLRTTFLIQILALCGLISLTITGALGGSIVYGINNDPFTNFIYRLFFRV